MQRFRRQQRLHDLFLPVSLAATLAAGIIGIGWYYTSHLEMVPYTNRRRFIATTKEQEIEMMKSEYNSILQRYRSQLLDSSTQTVKFVKSVAVKLICSAGLDLEDFEVYVINDPQLNAFVLPGGKIFVFTGILKVVDDADTMAVVIAHEMAHQIARHSGEKLSWIIVVLAAEFLVSIFMDPGPLIRQLVRQYGLISPFSRSCEKEADHIGLLLMAKACYDPEAAIRFWTRMKNLGSKQPLEYLSTHPSNDTRIKMIADWLPEAKQVGVEAGCSFVKALPYKRFG